MGLKLLSYVLTIGTANKTKKLRIHSHMEILVSLDKNLKIVECHEALLLEAAVWFVSVLPESISIFNFCLITLIGSAFSINNETGQISTTRPLDRENTSKYLLTVKVSSD